VRNGLTLRAERLVRGLREAGVDARLLLTEENTDLISIAEPRMLRPDDLPVDELPVGREEGWGARWGALIRYLEERAPCIYLPTFDWRHAAVVPRLSAAVRVVAWAWEDDPLCLEQLRRLADRWSGVVAFGPAAARRLRAAQPDLADRIAGIPDGVRISAAPPARPADPAAPLEILLSEGMGLDPGQPAAEGLRVSAAAAPDRCDLAVGLLGPDGPPDELLEAAGHGAVPLFIAAGGSLPEGFEAGRNCLLVAADDPAGLIDATRRLAADREYLRRLGREAWAAVARTVPRFEDMIGRYVSFLEQVIAAAPRAEPGPLRPPPPRVGPAGVFPVELPFEAPGVGRFPSAREFELFERHSGSAVPTE
jgi:hypothetical protein